MASPITRQLIQRTRCLTALGTAWLLASEIAHGAGYYGGPLGAKALGRGGAFVVLADDLSAAWYNPAGLARERQTLRLQLENRTSYSEGMFTRDATRDGRSPTAPLVSFEPSENSQRWSLLGPFFGAQSNFGLRDWTFALVSFTPSGTSSARFPLDGGQKYLLVERDVVVVNTSLSAAWRPLPNLALGISAQAISVPSIHYQLVIENTPGSGLDLYNPVSSPLDMLATIRASDPFTLNLTAGLWARPERHVEMGIAAQVLPANIQASGTLHVQPVSPSTVELLANQNPPIPPETAVELSRNGESANDVHLTLPLPLTFRAGARFIDHRADGRERFDVEFNATYETWSRVDTLTMNGNGLQARLAGLSNPIPLGVLRVPKRWQDSLTLALGGDLHADTLPVSLRMGVYVETPVAPKPYANIDFPVGAHIGATAGLALRWGAWVANIAYEHRRMLPFHVSENEGAIRQIKPNLGENPPPAATPPVTNAGDYAFTSHNVVVGMTWSL